jgi:Tfp pilus assembly protein PilO
MNLRRVLVDKRHIVFPLAIAALANVLLYALVVFPLGRQVASAEQEAKTQRELLNRARYDFQLAKATVAGKQQADAALQSTARTLTYTRLAQLAKQANVRLEHGSNTTSQEKDSKLAKLTTTYVLTGDYRDVRRFIYSLETAPEFIVLENVALTSANEQPGRTLGMNLEIATYYRAADGS